MTYQNETMGNMRGSLPALRRTRKGILLLASALCLAASAQTNGSNSPYSRYGFGLLSDRAQGFNKGMSALSYGMRGGTELNVKNPASYSAIDSLSFIFDIGISLQNGNLEQSGKKVNAHNTSFDYLSMGFRASKNIGISLGLVPFSTIGYDISQEDLIKSPNMPDITHTSAHSGDGGVHEAYLGIGWKAMKGLSVGLNAGYMWGDMTHTVLSSYSESATSSSRRQYASDFRSYKLDFGLQYEQKINKDNNLTLGLVYGLGHDVRSKSEYYNQLITSGSVISADTTTLRNAFQLPHTIGIGLTWTHKNRLRIGADYTLQKWGKIKFPFLNEETNEYVACKGLYKDMHKVTFGGEYIPNPDGIHRRDRIRYRAGFSLSTPYTKVNGLDGPKDYLVSLGVGLPIINTHNNRSVLNISAQYENVKPKFARMIKEQYLRLCIGLTFNERWFMKWKVD